MAQQQLYLQDGGDFVLNSNGGLQLAGSWDVIIQNLCRYIFTNPASTDRFGNPIPADWIFNPTFGLGANAMLGQNFNQTFINNLQQKIYQGVLAAQTGNSTVPPVVTVTQGTNPQQINVQAIITPTGQAQQTINVTLP
jgi:hypothetical protein